MANEMKCDSDVFDGVQKEYAGRAGYSGEILQKKVEIMKGQMNEKYQDYMDINKQNVWENKLAFLEISVVIHTIYIQRFLNRYARLVIGVELRGKDIYH